MPFDPRASVEVVRDYARRAVDLDRQLVLFPEAFVGGYPRGLTFGASVGRRTPEGRDWFRRYHEAAVDLDGPEVAELCGIAAATGLVMVVGVIERSGGTLYCTAVWLDPEEGVVGTRRKLLPTGTERVVWGSGDLSRTPVHQTRVGRVGAAICWENYMPLLRTYMYSKGVQIWCAPTADDRDGWVATMRHIALEGRCFVLAANQFVRRSDYPVDYPLDAPAEEVLCTGGSVIVDPLGTVLAGPEREGEALLCADLDLADIPRATLDFDAVGHYSRSDLFSLHVDTRPQHLVDDGTSDRPPVRP
ncbi:nitrilase [Pseudonocardia xishanensis]|uniref:Nitrilase n=1 Tax=Pseudonocardia xishanensis TaxID=630995 RepID=A0ABP8S0Z5_9PSEU